MQNKCKKAICNNLKFLSCSILLSFNLKYAVMKIYDFMIYAKARILKMAFSLPLNKALMIFYLISL